MSKKSNWKKDMDVMVRKAKLAKDDLGQLSTAKKNRVLMDVASLILKEKKKIMTENAKDLKAAKKNGLTSAMIDRLTLTEDRIKGMAEGVRVVAKLKDPIGDISSKWKRPNGLKISKMTVPIGVILIIFESRPNVTVECASLCFKSGNAVILRGGKEAYYSNLVLASIFERTLKKHKISPAGVQIVKSTDRAIVDDLLHREGDINLVIPRGGENLIRKVIETSRIPVIKHYQGICHVYVDQKANVEKAVAIAYNAKMQRPGVCNAMETLIVHKKVAPKFLPALGRHLHRDGCEIRGDKETKKLLPWVKASRSVDYGYEFLEKILAIKVVDDLDKALGHIQENGSGHTEAIITQDKKAADKFKRCVDASSVMVNASTRFADGFEYGFGAEIGISTDKIHARGPMGLEGLTTYKYVVEGTGQVRI